LAIHGGSVSVSGDSTRKITQVHISRPSFLSPSPSTMPPCRSCPPDDCAAYVAAHGSDTCYCGHGAAVHTAFPPRGRCVPTGCPRFQGDHSPHSLCTNPLCGRKWLAHMPLGDGGPTGGISLSSDQPPPTTSVHLYLPRWLPPYLGHCLQPNVCQRQPPRNAATKAFCITNLGAHGPKAGKKMVVFQTEASKPITIKGVLIPLAMDEEEDQLQAAIALSRQQEIEPATSSMSNAVSGPSQPRTSSLSRPRHLVRPRPESVSPPSRRPTRQRVEIDLTSESPPSGWGTSGWGSPPPFRLPTPEPAPKPKLRPATWASRLNIHRSPISLRVVMPTIEAGVSSTFARILSFFGGPSVADDSVQFVPQPDRYQLLARESEWTCGGSHGAGVRKTLASSLMEFVFTTRELYWVPVGDSGTYILRLPTSGDNIIGPAQRTLLQAFGFACQLYTTYVGFLPPQLSGVLAYYALGNDDDGEAFLLDDDLLANLCPEQATRIKEWPATLAEYKQIIQTPNVAQPTQLIYLTADIEELTPSQFINVCELEPGRYALAYKKHLRRIFFGTFQPLQSYAQLRAFSEGFNSPVNSPLAAHMTMGDRGHLLPLLAATRLNHPDELLAKIHWRSTNNPAMQAQEEKFRTAFERYIRIPGIVEHPLFPLTSRNEFETSAIYDAPRARALMFLRFVCGMTQLPARIGISFMWRIPRQTDPGLDEDGNFVETGLTRSLSATLLREELPNDDRATDFDLFQYLSYRPITAFKEFGGIV
ncbi:hypothetical protein C8F01DRAFT_1313085, partial [Mycena amicta]